MLQVTDAVGGVVRVRIVVSASNAGALFDLRCAVREGMVDWVQRTNGVVPTQRIEPAAPSPEPQARREKETPRVAAGIFSGSPEADESARVFDHAVEHDDELARTNGSR